MDLLNNPVEIQDSLLITVSTGKLVRRRTRAKTAADLKSNGSQIVDQNISGCHLMQGTLC